MISRRLTALMLGIGVAGFAGGTAFGITLDRIVGWMLTSWTGLT